MRFRGHTSVEVTASQLKNSNHRAGLSSAAHQQEIAANELLLWSPDGFIVIVDFTERRMKSESSDEIGSQCQQESHWSEYLQADELLQGRADVLVEGSV